MTQRRFSVELDLSYCVAIVCMTFLLYQGCIAKGCISGPRAPADQAAEGEAR